MLEKTLESPLDFKEIQPINPKGNQSWILIGTTDAEAETPILWPPDVKSWLTVKDPDAAKDWGQETKGTTEDEMVGWHHQLNGHGFGWTPGVGVDREAWRSWGHKELAVCIKWSKFWSFSISLSNDYSGLTSFRIDWFDLLAVQGTLKSLLQHSSSKA